ncbi:DUF3971 domain-containing protein [Aestuariibius sp. 2305UL40-4]|uniref:YhdP family protein n=1 Tax=Aestuariibius violaceus TaxID=3234132 RepID=UPI00345E9119
MGRRGAIKDEAEVLGDDRITTAPAGADPAEPSEISEVKSGRRLPWRICLGTLRVCVRTVTLTLVFIAAFVIAAALLIIDLEIRAPSWIQTSVAERVDAALGGGAVDFGEIYVRLGSDLHPRVRLTDVTLSDATGRRIARLQSADALISPRGLIFDQVPLVQTLDMTGAELALHRAANGGFAVAFDFAEGPSAPRSVPDMMARFDAILESQPLAALEEITAQNIVLNYTDARVGRSWVVDDGRVTIDLTEGRRLRADLSLLSGRAYASRLRVGLDQVPDTRDSLVSLSVEQMPAADMATQAPGLAFLSVLDAPITGAARTTLSGDGTVGPISGTLGVGAGALAPNAAAKPVRFDSAQSYVSFDPAEGRLSFDLIEVQSEQGGFVADGSAYLRDFENGFPNALVAQFSLRHIDLALPDLYEEPVRVDEVQTDFRLTLSPFSVDFGQISVVEPTGTLSAKGQVTVDQDGWQAALDATFPETTAERFKELWPASYKPKTRDWIQRNIREGRVTDISAGIRTAQGQPARYAVSGSIEDATIGILRTLPPIEEGRGFLTLENGGLQVAVTGGTVTPPFGGPISVAGSTFEIPDLAQKPQPARAFLKTDGSLGATLSLLDQEPFHFIERAGRTPELAEGRAVAQTRLELPLKRPLTTSDVLFFTSGTVTDAKSDGLIPNRTLTADTLGITAGPEGLAVEGAVLIDDVPARIRYAQPFFPGAVASVTGRVAVSQDALDTFGIGLPPGTVAGLGQANIALDLPKGAPPSFRLNSDLSGVRLAVPAIGWTKRESASGRLEISGALSNPPTVDALSLSAPGLEASGTLSLANGGLERLDLSRLRVGDWLNAPVTLRGRGPGATPAVTIRGGTMDLRNLPDFGNGSGGGAGAPIAVALDRLTVTDGIDVENFRSTLNTGRGLSGNFSGDVNGRAPVTGRLAPQNGGTALQIRSDNAGLVLRAADLVEGARKGNMDLVLVPTGARGSYDGQLSLTNIRLRDAPSMAALLDAISVVGLIQQLDGNGLQFDEVSARFRLTPNQIIVAQSSAVGPSLGLSLDGVYTLASKAMNFQGVVSPVYLVNQIGAPLTRRGEGLIGFNFNLAGTPRAPQVSVNPLSALTPGMFREIFRRPAPDLTQ